jgi:hypothetical protein
MGRTNVMWEDVPETGDPPLALHESGWRAFLRSWTLGAILAVGCVLGLIAVVSAHPFASASVSQRVSDKVGQPSSCTQVGAAVLRDRHSTIYRCTVGLKTHGSTRCFAISGGDINLLIGNRELGC